jgi:hypothetical protein
VGVERSLTRDAAPAAPAVIAPTPAGAPATSRAITDIPSPLIVDLAPPAPAAAGLDVGTDAPAADLTPGVVNGDPTGGLATPDDGTAGDTTKVGDPVIDPSLAPSAADVTDQAPSELNQAGAQAGGTRAPDAGDAPASGAQPDATRGDPAATRVTDVPR